MESLLVFGFQKKLQYQTKIQKDISQSHLRKQPCFKVNGATEPKVVLL